MSSGEMVRVTRLDETAAAAMCMLARSLGLYCLRIDLAGCADKQALLARIASALEFPEWFGSNWDALFDCLADLGWRPAAGYVLILEHAAGLKESEPAVFDTAVAILEDAAAAWAARGVPFRAFVSA